jgi:prephenate dehydratase
MSETIRVAYQGEPGAFSQSAAKRLLSEEASSIAFASFEEMFDAVVTGAADCCVAPIENSLAGSIHRNYDLLLESGLSIFGETNLRIVHNLIAAPAVILGDVRRVYSHPVALAQCGRYLRQRPEIEAIPVHDTAGAVRLVMERRSAGEAAIASDTAAGIYGATVLARGVEDNPQNFTRFLLAAPRGAELRTSDATATRRWKTSLLIRIANEPGSLFRTLGVFALAGIDLTKIESRPLEGKPWEYAFYIDVIGNASEAPLARSLDTLRTTADDVKVLGSYRTRW